MFKKILCLMLALIMLLSVVSCSNTTGNPSEATGENKGDKTEAASDEKTNENPVEKIEAEKYDGIFKVGYSRVDITPQMLPIPRKNNASTIKSVSDPIYATCIAFNDGKNTALVFTVDVCNVGEDHCNAIKVKVKAATKVPVENIFVHATHNHSSPAMGNPNNNAAVQKWTSLVLLKMTEAAEAAIADLADAKIQSGTGKTTGMAFVRRYLLEDGTYSGLYRRGRNQENKIRYLEVLRPTRARP